MTHLTTGGHLKIYLGYAPGVGKTYQMLEDARALKARGVDVVVGIVDQHGRNDIRDKLSGLRTIPLMRVSHRGGVTDELDVEAILKWSPRVCIVDELAHSNVPGSPRQKRWHDMQPLRPVELDMFMTTKVEDPA